LSLTKGKYGVLTRALGPRDAGRLVYVLSRGQEIEYPKCLFTVVCCVCEWLYHTAGIQCVSGWCDYAVGKLGEFRVLLICR